MPNGILIVDKPAGWTSQDVAAKLRGVFHEKRVGHGGTLDPMATGVLPIFLGRATRAVPFFEHADKVYEAVLRLGLVTDTQDTTGRVLEEHPVDITQEQLEAVLPRFRGPIQQIPPMYSAVKVNGQKLYALARKGQEVEREARTVVIHSLEGSRIKDQGSGNAGEMQNAECRMQNDAWAGGRVPSLQADADLEGSRIKDQGSGSAGEMQNAECRMQNDPCADGRVPSLQADADLEGSRIKDQGSGSAGEMQNAECRMQNDPCADGRVPSLQTDYLLRVHCSKGTYVRTLCHDIGAALGCGGCMAALRRTRAGRYGIEQAHSLDEILADPNPERFLLPVDSLFADRPRCTINEAGEKKLRNGASLRTGKLADGEYRVYGPGGDFLALCAVSHGELTTIKSFFEL